MGKHKFYITAAPWLLLSEHWAMLPGEAVFNAHTWLTGIPQYQDLEYKDFASAVEIIDCTVANSSPFTKFNRPLDFIPGLVARADWWKPAHLRGDGGMPAVPPPWSAEEFREMCESARERAAE